MIMIIIRCILVVDEHKGDETMEELNLQPEISQAAAKVIRERRTIRRFANRALSGEELEAMFRLAERTVTLEYDPEALRFVIFATEEGKRQTAAAIMAAYSNQGLYRWIPGKLLQTLAEQVAKTPAIVAVIRRESDDPSFNDRQLAAASAMIHSFTLLAWERKLGLVWNTEPVVEHEALAASIGLAGDERLVCLLYLGEYDKVPKGKMRKPASGRWTVLETVGREEQQTR